MKSISTLPFTGTQEQETELKTWLEANKDVPGITMSALQKAQDIYGYLPLEVQRMVSTELDKPLAEIYGIATFYSQFRLEPVGKNVVKICFGTACHVIGAENIADAICHELGIALGETTEDRMFTVESVACIGCCSLAPVITINEETHGRLTPETARAAIRDFKVREGQA